MQKDKVYEEIKKTCDKTTELTRKLLNKKRCPLLHREYLTVREKDIAHKLYILSSSLEYLGWAYEHLSGEYFPEVQKVVENAINVVSQEVQNLFEF